MVAHRILDLDFETLPGGHIGISYSGRDVSILISHVGIESHVFQAAARTQKVLARKDAIRKQFAPRRIILGADDLDLVKGSVTKLQGLNRFLKDNPDKRDKIVLVELISGSSNSAAEQKLVRDSSKSLHHISCLVEWRVVLTVGFGLLCSDERDRKHPRRIRPTPDSRARTSADGYRRTRRVVSRSGSGSDQYLLGRS